MRVKSPEFKARRKAKRARERIAYEATCAALKSGGASCGNCAHHSPYPQPGHKGEIICDLDTDFQGYAVTTPGRVCPRWELRS